MNNLTREDVLKLARLSRLRLSDEEVKRFTDEFNEILSYIQQLDAVDTKGYEPTSQVTGLKNITRPDTVRDYGESQSELLKNAPAAEAGQFKVKRVLE